jgi:hypothetical protein
MRKKVLGDSGGRKLCPMKAKRRDPAMKIPGIAALAALLALCGCASQSSEPVKEIRIVAQKSDLEGCESLQSVEVRFEGDHLTFATKKTIEHLGGNALLLPSVPTSGARGDAGVVRVAGSQGTAYRCPTDH